MILKSTKDKHFKKFQLYIEFNSYMVLRGDKCLVLGVKQLKSPGRKQIQSMLNRSNIYGAQQLHSFEKSQVLFILS